jgi:DNA repair exonuclease SbcCD ATPase subunit
VRLKCIKLAGFKSFVDPTTVNFPSNMAAVVGPNGCGKSNIIDAVRWVMGESSAKNLRGESMTDVIFNGSTSRKPVSQASIELVFDNSDGTLVGEYAAYAEISIRRKVTRDSQNSYFLNGTKCRRRDITDIFLGTGLGPRSYSIIEQGMISKLIEAKPEDLRNFIEEAAGISKYKERRRETENRIRRTHENLARLTDLREELERQLERLHRQAEAAKKYQEYKAEERQLKAQLSALRWQDLNDQVGQREAIIGTQEVSFRGWSPSSAMPMPASSACATGITTCPSASIWCRGASIRSAATSPGSSRASSTASSAAPVAGRSERSRARAPGNRIAPGPRPHLAADPRRRAGHAHPRAGSHQRRRRRSRRRAGRVRNHHARLAGAVGHLQPDRRRTATSGRSAAVANPAAGNQPGASGRSPEAPW